MYNKKLKNKYPILIQEDIIIKSIASLKQRWTTKRLLETTWVSIQPQGKSRYDKKCIHCSVIMLSTYGTYARYLQQY